MFIEESSRGTNSNLDIAQARFLQKFGDSTLKPRAAESFYSLWYTRRYTLDDQVQRKAQCLLVFRIVRCNPTSHCIVIRAYAIDNGSAILLYNEKFIRVADLLFLVKSKFHHDGVKVFKCR